MHVVAVIGAVVGGVVGALIWALVAGMTGFEIGYVAWGVGGLVGLGSWTLGGRGKAAGSVAACVALLSIAGGRMLTIDHVMTNAGLEGLYHFLSPQAEAFSKVHGEDGYAEFMVEHHYTAAESPSDVTREEIEQFKQNAAPLLAEMGHDNPSFEDWREKEKVKECWAQASAEISTFEVFRATLTPIDLLFAFLGIGTAFRICMKEDAAVA